MELSHYLKVYPYEEKPGHLLLFSTKKASKILLEKKTFAALEKGIISSEHEVLLLKLGMLVPDRAEEKRSLLTLIDTLKPVIPGLNLMVVLTLDCNFACRYCYEGDMKGKLFLSDETADFLISFVKKQFAEDKKLLLIDFYGGEPLLSLARIKTISRSLSAVAQEKGASYSFTLTTNGSLFTRRIAEELVPLGLQRVKITLDGPPDVHNHCRPFKSGAGSFDTIFKNIRETCDLVKINIGGNYDQTTWEEFPRLLDIFRKEGLTPDKINLLKFDPVAQLPKGDLTPTDYTGGSLSVNEPWIMRTSTFLREEILKRGYKNPKTAPVVCMVDNRDSLVVNVDGTLYKCPCFIGKEEFAAGNVRSGINEDSSAYKPGIWKNEECKECVYLPLCFGGCRYMSFVRKGTIGIDCQKAYLDATLETLVKQDIKYRK